MTWTDAGSPPGEMQTVRAAGVAERLTGRVGCQVDAADVIEACAELGLVLHIDPRIDRAMRMASVLRRQPGPITRLQVRDAARRQAVGVQVLLEACALHGIEVVP